MAVGTEEGWAPRRDREKEKKDELEDDWEDSLSAARDEFADRDVGVEDVEVVVDEEEDEEGFWRRDMLGRRSAEWGIGCSRGDSSESTSSAETSFEGKSSNPSCINDGFPSLWWASSAAGVGFSLEL